MNEYELDAKINLDNDQLSVNDVIRILKYGDRQGAEDDAPEGARYLQISDTLAMRMAECLTNARRKVKPTLVWPPEAWNIINNEKES